MTTNPQSPDELVLKVAKEVERVFYEAVDRGDMRGPQAFEHVAHAAISALPELTALQQRVKQLEEALEPFAAIAAKLNPDLADDTPVTLALGTSPIYFYALGRFRKARSLLGDSK